MTNASSGSAPEVVTFGCRLNAFESQVMRAHAENAGLSDTVIFNTCAVTGEAVRQARQAIRKVRRDHPEKKIVVTGCAAQIDASSFAEMDEVDTVLGNEEKLAPETYTPDFGLSGNEKVRVNDIMSVKETAGHMIEGLEGRARAFVQIQTGCDHRCTFCIIPYGRGNSRSVPAGEVVLQIQRLVDNGYREVVLTGVDLTSFGPDLPGEATLGKLTKQILDRVPKLDRLRLSSIDSIEVDPTLMDLISNEPRLMPHFHLSLQSGDDMILKRMKRRHARDDAIRFCMSVRQARPDVAFGADFIAGFPTETDDMFENTLGLVDECGLTFLHVFPYSARPGTPAAQMPQVDGALIKARAARLRKKGEDALLRHLNAKVGTAQRILMEKERLGHTEDFTLVAFDKPQQPGHIVTAAIVNHDGRMLQGAAKEAV